MSKKKMKKEGAGVVKAARWPSLKEQLTEAKVTRRSALEKLIKENQQFHILRPEEAHDGLKIPPWLRVYWREHHPERDYAAENPSGGYPRLLRRVHEWMLMHQDLRPASESRTGLRSKGGRYGR
jgi:hypothetical protein